MTTHETRDFQRGQGETEATRESEKYYACMLYMNIVNVKRKHTSQ